MRSVALIFSIPFLFAVSIMLSQLAIIGSAFTSSMNDGLWTALMVVSDNKAVYIPVKYEDELIVSFLCSVCGERINVVFQVRPEGFALIKVIPTHSCVPFIPPTNSLEGEALEDIHFLITKRGVFSLIVNGKRYELSALFNDGSEVIFRLISGQVPRGLQLSW